MVEQPGSGVHRNQRQQQIGGNFMRRHRLSGQRLVGPHHRRQLADKEKIDAPPAGVGVQDAEDRLRQQ